MQADSSISVADLLARNLGLEWHEAVALVQAVCAEHARADASDTEFPAPADVLIAPTGEVHVWRYAAASDGAPAAAARMTSALLNDAPVQLRLAITQATGSDSPYSTLAGFSAALAYFERPDRQGTIRGVVEKMHAAPVLPDAMREPDALYRKPRMAAAGRLRRYGRVAVRVAAVLAVLVAAGVVAHLALPGGLPLDRASMRSTYARVTGAVASAGEVVGEGVTAGVVAVGSRVPGVGRLLTTDEVPEEAPLVEEPAPPRPAPAARRAPATPVDPAAVAEPEAPPATPATIELREEMLAEPVPEAGAASPTESDALDDAALAMIYSAEHPEVVPPVALRPQLPTGESVALSPMSPSTPGRGRGLLELIIGPNGQVEHAVLRSSTSVRDGMLVSAAKAWRFEPALLDGRPVRYRHWVWIER